MLSGEGPVAGDVVIGLSNHAIERYQERQKPALGLELARRELLALLELAPPIDRPEWFHGDETADQWLELAPGCVAAVLGSTVVTVVCELYYSPSERKAVNREKARERSARKTKNRSQRHSKQPGNRARIEAESWPV